MQGGSEYQRQEPDMEMTPELVQLLARLLDRCIQMAQQEQQAARTRHLTGQIRAILDAL